MLSIATLTYCRVAYDLLLAETNDCACKSTALHFAAAKHCSCHSWIVAAPANHTNSRYQNSTKPTHFCGNFTMFTQVWHWSRVWELSGEFLCYAFNVLTECTASDYKSAVWYTWPKRKNKSVRQRERKKDVRLEKDRLGEKKKSKRTYQTVRCTQGTTQKQKYFTQLYFHITDNGESFSAAFAWRSNLQQTQNNIIINYAHTRHNNLCSHSSLSVSHNFPHSHTQQK